MAGQLFKSAELADAIGAVREEVIRAQVLARQEEFSFRVGPVDMEFEVALVRDDFGGRLRVLVITDDDRGAAVSKSSKGEAATHRVRLTLEPVEREQASAIMG
jgi:hypothetical protein